MFIDEALYNKRSDYKKYYPEFEVAVKNKKNAEAFLGQTFKKAMKKLLDLFGLAVKNRVEEMEEQEKNGLDPINYGGRICQTMFNMKRLADMAIAQREEELGQMESMKKKMKSPEFKDEVLAMHRHELTIWTNARKFLTHHNGLVCSPLKKFTVEAFKQTKWSQNIPIILDENVIEPERGDDLTMINCQININIINLSQQFLNF